MSQLFEKKNVHYRYDYENILQDLKHCEEIEDWDKHANIVRTMSREDLFFLLYYTCYRTDVNQPFVVDRCYEVNDCAENTLDLWAREFYKSTANYTEPFGDNRNILSHQRYREDIFKRV